MIEVKVAACSRGRVSGLQYSYNISSIFLSSFNVRAAENILQMCRWEKDRPRMLVYIVSEMSMYCVVEISTEVSVLTLSANGSAILCAACCIRLLFGSCMANGANKLTVATVINRVQLAAVSYLGDRLPLCVWSSTGGRFLHTATF